MKMKHLKYRRRFRCLGVFFHSIARRLRSHSYMILIIKATHNSQVTEFNTCRHSSKQCVFQCSVHLQTDGLSRVISIDIRNNNTWSRIGGDSPRLRARTEDTHIHRPLTTLSAGHPRTNTSYSPPQEPPTPPARGCWGRLCLPIQGARAGAVFSFSDDC